MPKKKCDCSRKTIQKGCKVRCKKKQKNILKVKGKSQGQQIIIDMSRRTTARPRSNEPKRRPQKEELLTTATYRDNPARPSQTFFRDNSNPNLSVDRITGMIAKQLGEFGKLMVKDKIATSNEKDGGMKNQEKDELRKSRTKRFSNRNKNRFNKDKFNEKSRGQPDLSESKGEDESDYSQGLGITDTEKGDILEQVNLLRLFY